MESAFGHDGETEDYAVLRYCEPVCVYCVLHIGGEIHFYSNDRYFVLQGLMPVGSYESRTILLLLRLFSEFGADCSYRNRQPSETARSNMFPFFLEV